jgi:hypothetical protein
MLQGPCAEQRRSVYLASESCKPLAVPSVSFYLLIIPILTNKKNPRSKALPQKLQAFPPPPPPQLVKSLPFFEHEISLPCWTSHLSCSQIIPIHIVTPFLRSMLILKNAVFCDVAPRSFCVDGRFGGSYRLHQKNLRARNQREQTDSSILKM